eukprot:6190787-Pleurochrysis_carterae.AAC.3
MLQVVHASRLAMTMFHLPEDVRPLVLGPQETYGVHQPRRFVVADVLAADDEEDRVEHWDADGPQRAHDVRQDLQSASWRWRALASVSACNGQATLALLRVFKLSVKTATSIVCLKRRSEIRRCLPSPLDALRRNTRQSSLRSSSPYFRA